MGAIPVEQLGSPAGNLVDAILKQSGQFPQTKEFHTG
jgi:hypothetical protein